MAKFKKNQPNAGAFKQNSNHYLKSTSGQKTAEKVARLVGSWPFIVTQTVVIAIWTVVNIFAFVWQWDPYPFIFLNLMLSVQAAYSAPIILMAQNRGTEIDRMRMINDLATTRKAEREVEAIQKQLDRLEKKINLLVNDGKSVNM